MTKILFKLLHQLIEDTAEDSVYRAEADNFDTIYWREYIRCYRISYTVAVIYAFNLSDAANSPYVRNLIKDESLDVQRRKNDIFQSNKKMINYILSDSWTSDTEQDFQE